MAGEVSFTPSERDYVDANRDWYRTLFKGRRGILKLAVPIAVGISLGSFFSWIAGEAASSFPYIVFVYAMLGLIVGLMMYSFLYLTLPRRAARLFRQQKTFQQCFQYMWSDDGITLRTPSSEARYAWSQIYRWADGRTALLLFFNEQIFYFIPRRVLGPEEWADLKAAVESGGIERL
ncbi:MAG TPA: YcxB family protein [Allosphingosinicella sp.]|jgi:hypothetical protein